MSRPHAVSSPTMGVTTMQATGAGRWLNEVTEDAAALVAAVEDGNPPPDALPRLVALVRTLGCELYDLNETHQWCEYGADDI